MPRPRGEGKGKPLIRPGDMPDLLKTLPMRHNGESNEIARRCLKKGRATMRVEDILREKGRDVFTVAEDVTVLSALEVMK